MPLTHTRSFRVRSYECDPHGQVKQAHYLRWAQEAALDASAAAGYDTQRYLAMGTTWLIRETKIEFLHALRYGDTVEIKTWVADFRRVRSQRAYEFRLAGDGGLVARAITDWAYLDSSSGWPIAIPDEMKDAFAAEGLFEPIPARKRFSTPPPAPAGAYRQRRHVEWRDLDEVGHVNNAVYLDYVEDCGLQMLAAHGWPISRLANEGLALGADEQHLEYKLPALPDDELEISTWLSAPEEKTVVRHSSIVRVRDGVQLVRAQTRHVWLDRRDGQTVAAPPGLLGDLAPATFQEAAFCEG